MIYILHENKAFDTQIKYVFCTLFKILDLEINLIDSLPSNIKGDDLLIYYGNHPTSRCNVIQIKPSYLFSDKYMSLESMPRLPLKQFRDNPIIYTEDSDEEPYIVMTNNKICTNLDIIQSSFFMLTRYDEIILWDKISKDSHNRFPVTESIAYKEKFLSKPIVNEYIEWLWQWISSFYPGIERKNWWGKYDFCLSLTHDVDITYAPYWTFDYIMNSVNSYGFKSSFYFMSGGTSNFDNFYRISDEKIISMINAIHNDGFEVGFHGSYNSFNDFEQMKKEKDELDIYNPNKTYGTRQHYLRFKAPITWNIQEKLGFLYDTTLSFQEYIGFRCGICMPYKVFDIFENREMNLYEIPLIIMDGTLAYGKYMNLDRNQSLIMIKQYIDIVRKYRGIFSLLWHNSSFSTGEWEGWKMVFEGCLEYVKENNGTGKTGKDIVSIFR
jgi:hypothetical protein